MTFFSCNVYSAASKGNNISSTAWVRVVCLSVLIITIGLKEKIDVLESCLPECCADNDHRFLYTGNGTPMVCALVRICVWLTTAPLGN